MNTTDLTIGTVAELSQCTVPTIRYYEQIGLVPPARRNAGRRYYRDEDVKRLIFIRRCRDFGFPLERVKEMVGLYENGDRECTEVKELAAAQLAEVQLRLRELHALEESLVEFVGSCNSTSCNGTTRDCVIIEGMKDSSFLEVRRK